MTKLEDYASEPGKSAMDLVLFRCAILPLHCRHISSDTCLPDQHVRSLPASLFHLTIVEHVIAQHTLKDINYT